MKIKKEQFARLVRSFSFAELFNELGWNNDRYTQPISVDKKTYTLNSVADKSGFKIMVCQPDADGNIPDSAIRRKIDHQFTKLKNLHLIIYTDARKTKQVWQYIVKQPNKPARVCETQYSTSQDPELLYQKTSGLFFNVADEDNITIIDVRDTVQENFAVNAERVTKQFYERFTKEHATFYGFVKGIDDFIDQANKKSKKKVENKNKQWYTSLMLNRLMFCYFIQKKGFLNNDRDYLKNKLAETPSQRGKNKFYSFYRDFLLILFHDGLNQPHQSENVKKEIGHIPYLNGGLFDVHEIERGYKEIEIDDDAFEKIFAFFDYYNWHLDTRITATGKDINPDVIGYIFEKYINDRASMGAYYTKEDITEYISKNCIVPFLFDETERKYDKAFKPSSEMWQMLKDSSADYIYPPVKHGISLNALNDPSESLDKPVPLPADIAIGLDIGKPNLLERRKEWNKPAPPSTALPTEIWREVIDRRMRYDEVKKKIENGEINHINDFITYNLNIRQFAQDVMETTTDPDFIRHFYNALSNITILDPTCGSGAFLFAAMNVLEPLYEACLLRMENFIEENGKGKHKKFEEILDIVKSPEHPNLQYFIFKSIILNNLYGVDLMREAVEIAKLRLFLKLVATVDPNYRKPNLGLEPLPDIDFNIRSGNTLVGYASERDLETGSLDWQNDKAKVEEEMEKVSRAFKRFKEIQLSGHDDYASFKSAKDELRLTLKKLTGKLDKSYYNVFGEHKLGAENWMKTHVPFHWFAEFYEIIHDRKGFDVVIGNPPYIAMKKLEYDLKISDFRCSDLFGYVIRRCFQILSKESRYGFIVMHNLAFSRNFEDVRRTIKNNASSAWFSFYARIPAGLFSGDVRVRNCIFLIDKSAKKNEKKFYTTRIHRWFTEARNQLLPKVSYTPFKFSDAIPMFNSNPLASFYENSTGKELSYYETDYSKHQLYFKQSAYNWVAVSTKPAPCFSKQGRNIPQSQVSYFFLASEDAKEFALLLLNGKVFFSQWLTFGDEFHLTRDDIFALKVPFEKLRESDLLRLKKLALKFERELDETVQYKLNAGKKVGTFNTSKLWRITDESDQIFLQYLCDNPSEVFNSIQDHIYQTVITTNDENEDE